jgi:hypothetical protein
MRARRKSVCICDRATVRSCTLRCQSCFFFLSRPAWHVILSQRLYSGTSAEFVCNGASMLRRLQQRQRMCVARRSKEVHADQ